MALIGLYSGSYILKHKDERGFKLGKSRQTAKSAYNGIVEKYGVVKPGSKYHHVGNKVWRIYLIKNDRKRTGETTEDKKKWGKQPHKWDYKGVDTKRSKVVRTVKKPINVLYILGDFNERIMSVEFEIVKRDKVRGIELLKLVDGTTQWVKSGVREIRGGKIITKIKDRNIVKEYNYNKFMSAAKKYKRDGDKHYSFENYLIAYEIKNPMSDSDEAYKKFKKWY